jgi:pimeloyl-ACP methyl ester carboxylesterase
MAQRLRERTSDTAAGATAWREAGEGPAVILIHGVGLNADAWAPQIDALTAAHRVIAYDTLGHGQSPLPPERATLGDYVSQLAQLLDALDLRRASLVGHSMGAMIAIATALRQPDRTERLIALNGVYGRTPEQRAAALGRARLLDRDGPASTRQAALERWFGPAADGAFARERMQVEGWLQAVDPVGYARAYRVFATSDVGRLDGLACPALFMTGELDPHSTPEMTRAMAAAAPLGRAVVLPGHRHMAAFVAPEICNPVILEFLRDKA